MATLTLRDLPEDTRKLLATWARREHRSLNAQLLVIVEHATHEWELSQVGNREQA